MSVHGRKWAALFAGLALSFTANASEPEAIPGEFIVKMKAPVTQKSTVNLLKSDSTNVKSVLEHANVVVVQRPIAEKSTFAMDTLKSNPNVEYVEPNYIYRISALPDDPELENLWGLVNNGQNDPAGRQGVAGVDIGAEEAWDIQTGSRDIVVAVIDTGIDPLLGDLNENMWINEAEQNGEEGVDDDGNGYVDDVYGYNFVADNGALIDDHGHGSHCAGTIGAKGNDGEGLVGVAWNVRLMGVKFLSGSGGGSLENAIKSIDYARINEADIMSNSWGGGGFSQALQEAIERANEAGIVFTAAAGNSRQNNDSRPTYPANYEVDNVISVAAIDNSGNLASFSSYGRTTVHVGAPGVNVLSSTPRGYQSWSGTSMATPHVSGIIALLLSNEDGLNPLQVRERIVSTSRPVAGLRGKTQGGLANAYFALTNQLPPPDPNDPSNWDSVPFAVSSPHPYTDNFTETYEVRLPGVTRLAVYFDRFELENNYDKVKVKDADGNLVGTLTGTLNGVWSPPVNGDTLFLEMTTDRSVTGYGFDVSKIAFERDEEE